MAKVNTKKIDFEMRWGGGLKRDRYRQRQRKIPKGHTCEITIV